MVKIQFVKLTIDKAGRIVLPKLLRDDLHLQPGDELDIERCGEELTLRPSRGQRQLRKKHGVWVYRGGDCAPPEFRQRTYCLKLEKSTILRREFAVTTFRAFRCRSGSPLTAHS